MQKAWGIGLGRTGTWSLDRALSILGYQRVIHNPSFEQLLQADAASDNGCVLYYKFLDYKFPGSKFILTTRDKQSWLESYQGLFEIQGGGRRDGQNYILPRIENNTVITRRMQIYETLNFEWERYADAYDRHYADVRRYFRQRPADLLEMNITAGDGWEKLCPFLGLKIPGDGKIPFPRLNTREYLAQKARGGK